MGWFFTSYRWFLRRIGVTLVLILVFGILENALRIYLPNLIGDSIDSMTNGTWTISTLERRILLLVGLALIVYVLSYLKGQWLQKSPRLLGNLLKFRFFNSLTKQAPAYFLKHPTGSLLNAMAFDVPAISQVVGEGVVSLSNISITAPLYLGAMLLLVDVRLTIVSLLPLPLVSLSINMLGKWINREAGAFWGALTELNQFTYETVSGMKVLRAYVQEANQLQVYDALTQKVVWANKRLSLVNALFWPAVALVMGIASSVGMVYGSYMVRHHQISIGQLVAFLSYLTSLSFPLFAFGALNNTLQQAKAAHDRFAQVIDAEDLAADDRLTIWSRTIAHTREWPELEARELRFRFPNAAEDCLRGVSFRLKQGQTLGIVGTTGSGKSTLLKVLLRQIPLESGRLFVAGQDAETIELEAWWSRFAYVPQEQLLFSRSIDYNVRFGAQNAEEEHVWQVLRAACLADDVVAMQDGIDTLVGEQGVKLSGGQKQRLSIARALLVEPEILVLDDALSAVDAGTEEELITNLRELRRGRTTVIATQRLSAVRHADLILVLHEGQIIQRGTHEALMRQGGWYAQQVERQSLEAVLNAAGEEAV